MLASKWLAKIKVPKKLPFTNTIILNYLDFTMISLNFLKNIREGWLVLDGL